MYDGKNNINDCVMKRVDQGLCYFVRVATFVVPIVINAPIFNLTRCCNNQLCSLQLVQLCLIVQSSYVIIIVGLTERYRTQSVYE